MSLVSSFGTSGRATGGGRVMGAEWARSPANMSVQYRPELGSISLNPQFPSDSAGLRPLFLDLAAVNQGNNLPPLGFNQANNLLPSPVALEQSNQTLLSMKLEAQQQQAIYRALNRRSHGLVVPPLAPRDSGVGLSDTPILASQSMESYRFRPTDALAHSRASAFYGETSYRDPSPSSYLQDVQFSDLPIVRGAAAFQSAHSTRPVSFGGEPALQVRADSRGNGESKRLKRTLEELERELLSDDADLTSSICEGGRSELSMAPDKDWADVIQDFLCETSPLPSQSLGSSTMTSLSDRSTVSSVGSSGSINQIREEGSFASEVADQANSIAHRACLAQQQTLATQRVQATAEVIVQPKQLLIACASAIAENKLELANSMVARLKQVVSVHGDPMQRLAAYMMEGLIARIEQSVRGVYRPVNCTEPPPTDQVLSAMQVLFRVCPYFRFGYMAANGAIAEAFKDEEKVHIVDFEIGQGSQWLALIGAFAARPGGPPQVRITGVDDPDSASSLQSVGKRLEELAKSVGVPFQFHPVARKVSEVEPWMLHKRPGEALAVNFAFQLHRMPDESVCTTNPRDRLLRMVRAMEPKVVTLVEQEANTNTAPFLPRFHEALSYYTALFESLDVSLRRDNRDRVSVEQHCLARNIVNIISCEGAERVERYEPAGKWRARMTMAGFRPCPLSSYINTTIKSLLQNYSSNYRLKEEGGALYLGWLDRVLIVASAWQ